MMSFQDTEPIGLATIQPTQYRHAWVSYTDVINSNSENLHRFTRVHVARVCYAVGSQTYFPSLLM